MNETDKDGVEFRIGVPTTLSDKDLVGFFRGWKWFEEPSGAVTIDLSQALFVAPWAAALFATYGLWLREALGRPVNIWLDSASTAGRFLTRVGFRELVNGQPFADLPGAQDRVVPLTRIQTSKDIQPCVTNVLRLLAIEDAEMADAIKYSLVELLRNVVQHARSKTGAIVTAVYHPTSGLVSVAVADFGCGIRASLHHRYKEIKDDYKAVKFALQPHVSGTFQQGAYESMANNAGLGLFFIKEIATRSGGGFFLGSGNMLADLWGNLDGTAGKKYFTATSSGWRGTFALLQMRRDHIVQFDSLLQHCRDIAAEVRKDPTELKLDFVEEVPVLEGMLCVRVKDFEEDVEAAALLRDEQILPELARGGLVVIDFSGIRAATQSFVHALMYRVFRDGSGVEHSLSLACAGRATQEAIRAVAAYARVGESK